VEEAIPVKRETKDQLVWMALKERLVHWEKRVSLVPVVCLENLVQRVQKDLKDHVEKLVHQDPLVKRVRWEFQDFLATLEEEVRKETEDWLAKEVEMVKQVHLVLQVQMVTEEKVVQEDPEVNVDREVFQAQLVPKEKQDHLAPLVHLEPQVLKVTVVPVDTLEHPAPLVSQEKMVLLAYQEREENLAALASRVNQVLLVL